MNNEKQKEINKNFNKRVRDVLSKLPDLYQKQDMILIKGLEEACQREKELSNHMLNQLYNNGSVMINTSIVSKEDESEIVWTIIDDPYIKKD